MSSLRPTIRRVRAILPIACFAVFWMGCTGEYPQTTFRPVTDFGAQINDLFTGIFWWTMLVLAIVYVVLIYVLVRYRDRPGAEARKTYGNNLAEIGWTLGPAVIVVLILVPTVRTIFRSYERAPEGALVVEAVGHQWWWEFRYPDLGVVTANELHLPVGRPVEVRLRSVDVLHNWWVPRLGGKRYNYPVPARAEGTPEPNLYHLLSFTVEEPGEYSGQCAEYCGMSHALMRMRVVASPPEEFDAWLDAMRASRGAIPEGAAQPAAAGVAPAQAAAPQSLEAQGYQVFLRAGCIACHTIEGTPAAGVLGPNLTRIGARWAIGAGLLPNTPENLKKWIRNSPALKPGSKMPPFPQLSEEDLTALVAYLGSLE
ncbi:MAG TPA: cytochrome c oxidase subunit II [Longimicrobiales bacterium]